MRARTHALVVAAAVAASTLTTIGLATPEQSDAACRWGKFSAERPPGGCWRPFSAESPFNRPLPGNPRQPLNSTWLAETVDEWGSGPVLIAGIADTDDDFNHPLYFSSRSNPVYRINCLRFGGDCPIDGTRVRIPRLARPAGGSDAHLAVIDQREGWEYDLWEVGDKPRGGGLLNIGWGGRTRIGTDDAHGLRAGGTASGFALSAGVIRPAELRAGRIEHALFMSVPCTNGRSVYPSAGGAGTACADTLFGDATVPPMGSRFYLEMAPSEIDALAVAPWQKTILRAMARYGMFIGDTGGSSWGIGSESGSSQTSFGRPDPWVKLAQRFGLPGYVSSDGTTRYTFDLRGIVDWARELRVAAPCVSHGRC
jgi:hypothetical protein